MAKAIHKAVSTGKDPNRVRLITEKIIGLPTLPSVVAKVIELVDNPKTSAAGLARLIATDQALTAKILKLANSAYYGFPREISTVNLAIVVLGFNTVKDMGLSISVLNVFRGGNENQYFDISKFWEHSIAVGVAARFLGRMFRYRVIGEAFVAGLLDDVVKVVMDQYLHEEFVEVMKEVHENNVPLLEAEEKILSATHAQIGGWLAEKWNLPHPITEAIRFHHEPRFASRHKDIVLLTHFSDYVVRMAKIGDSGNKDLPELDEEVIQALGKVGILVDPESLERIKTEFLLELDKAEAFFSIIKNNEFSS
jgi:HD-like signal output (HDOD) protein